MRARSSPAARSWSYKSGFPLLRWSMWKNNRPWRRSFWPSLAKRRHSKMEVTTQVPGSQKMEPIQNHFFSDLSVMLGRSMRHIFRSLDTIITVLITPIAMMLLFVYVFGGAIQSETARYVNYILPGILLIAIASGIYYTALRLFTD